MSHNEYEIRRATASDTEAMVRVALEAWKPVFESFRSIMGNAIFDAAYIDWRADKARQITTAASPGSDVSFLVAEEHGEEGGAGVVGFVSWVVRTDETGAKIAEIGNNAVDPTRHNRGIATAYYAEVIRRCREAGVVVIKVTTGLDPSHAPARRAYEKAGFAHGIPMVTYWQDLR